VSVPAAVRVLPSSRPEPRTWLGPSAWREAASAAPEEPAARPRPGRVQRVGRAWGAQVPDALPDAARWSGWFALALAEAVLGRRPATQLAGWVSADVLANLNRRQRLRPAGDAAPRTVLLSGRVQHPGPRSAEACAVLRSGPRLLVLAYRLEAREGQWLCTALEAGLTSGARRRPARPGGDAAPGPALAAAPAAAPAALPTRAETSAG
jgi:hypothetical protein